MDSMYREKIKVLRIILCVCLSAGVCTEGMTAKVQKNSIGHSLAVPSVKEAGRIEGGLRNINLGETGQNNFPYHDKKLIFEALFDLSRHPDDINKRRAIVGLISGYNPAVVAEAIFEYVVYIGLVYNHYRTRMNELKQSLALANGRKETVVLTRPFTGVTIPVEYEKNFFKIFSHGWEIYDRESFGRFHQHIMNHQRSILNLTLESGAPFFLELLLILEKEQYNRDLYSINSPGAYLASNIYNILDKNDRAKWKDLIYKFRDNPMIGYGKTSYYLFITHFLNISQRNNTPVGMPTTLDTLVDELTAMRDEKEIAVILSFIINLFVIDFVETRGTNKILPRQLKEIGCHPHTVRKLIDILERLMISSRNPFIIRTAFSIYYLIRDLPWAERDAQLLRICESALDGIADPKLKCWMMLNIMGYYDTSSYNFKFIRFLTKMLGKGKTKEDILENMNEKIAIPYTKTFMDVFTEIVFNNSGVCMGIQDNNLRLLKVSQ